MKKAKIWLITGACLILIGCFIFGGVMNVLNWDFKRLSTVKYETNNYDIDESFKDISIITNTADIEFIPSNTSKISVNCYEQKNLRHSVSVKDDTLVIEVIDTRKWYEHIGINFSSPKITVSIPVAEYGSLSIKSSTGDIGLLDFFKFKSIDITASTGDVTNLASAHTVKIKLSTGNIVMESIYAGLLDLSVSTGKIMVTDAKCEGDIKVKVSTGKTSLTDIKCENIISSGSTGNLSLKNVIATQKFSLERSTGDVTLENADANEIYIKTDTGDVRGSLLSPKVFITQSDTGSINVPKTVTGGRCEITTDTGNIKITIKE